ncbi:putative AAA+ superfamily ATPase [Aequitasia blattaphilus]|uniref:ATP-binding protein n=1 Tax=Aequitasia blattaphilus TaxID=2949332 RepID=A0ABT1E7S2_9FIRM|nr:ATP-binding protein [Aequitasia blattaphilus]MCP1101878.1 ATP-binding protein [Aequitasia blattaphilus]MCR8614518.1 ATP-binding protein [Aequitasia blattaphilus]
MKRFAMDNLLKWKDKKNRKPLILKGARQVGKTWLMKSFGEQYFENVAYVNFDNNQRMRETFELDYDIERIIMAINIETKQPIVPGKTLILFDEVQEVPRAISALKYFNENAPEYHIIAAGSLLGVAIHSGVSFPVGKVETLQIEPMNFREFLLAIGEQSLADLIDKEDYQMMQPFSGVYVDWLKKYYYIGGMPEVVENFVENRDFSMVRELQNTILELYEDDFGKHTEATELPRIRMVWNAVPMQLAKENKKFFFGNIKTGARAKDFEMAIEWLLDCGLIKKVPRIQKPGMPLKAYMDFSAFKIYLLDVGLLGAMSELDALSILEGNSIFTEFKGALTEQYVLQQLEGDTPYTPYYFSASEHNEIDFIIQKGRGVVPIEVKAEANLQSKSLKAYCDKYKPNYAVRTSMLDYKEQEWMTNIPLYAIHNI